MNEKLRFLISGGAMVALTPVLASADSLGLVVLNLIGLIGVIVGGINLHKLIKQGIL